VVGVWTGFGVGSPKQFFIIKKVGNKLRGMVCGTCDNPYTMAALDDFQIEGDTLKFNILHEDWADGDLPTFYKHVTAHVGWNEMRCSTAADHMPPPRPLPSGALPGFSLTGPIPIEATASARLPKIPSKRSNTAKNRRKLRVASSNENVAKPMFLMALSVLSTSDGFFTRTVRVA